MSLMAPETIDDNMRQEGSDSSEDTNAPHREKKRFKRSSQACMYCQRLKMKCSGTVPCERCIKSKKECTLPGRTRRKAWSKKKDFELQTLHQRIEEMEGKLRNNPGEPSTSTLSSTSRISTSPLQQHATIGDNTNSASNRNALTWIKQVYAQPPTSGMAFAPEGQIHINWSLANLEQMPFVHSKLMTAKEAQDLYDSFMNNCLIHIPLLDPEKFTLRYTCSTCPFLFAVIVYISSVYSRNKPMLREELNNEMITLIGDAFTSGYKSLAIVQAFLLLYFFNRPASDPKLDQAWMYSGTAIRMATDLGLSTSSDANESEIDRMDRERTWLICFMVDRTLSAARGKQWTIHGDDSILGNSDTWWTQLSSRSWDVSVAAHVDLLKVTSRQTDVLNAALSNSSGLGESFDCETMMRIMNDELEQWRRRWHLRGFFTSPSGDFHHFKEGSSEEEEGKERKQEDAVDAHTRILYFTTRQALLRYNHAVLVLNCFGLQYWATHNARPGAKTYSLTQAIRAAQGVAEAVKDGLGGSVAYSPHTQYTIFSFSIISLIKLASMKREDIVISTNLIRIVESCIAFLESVAIRPDHVPARCASMLRGLLRRSSMIEKVGNFRPGMDDFSLPNQSSRGNTPVDGEEESQASPLLSNHAMHLPAYQQNESIPPQTQSQQQQQQQQQQSQQTRGQQWNASRQPPGIPAPPFESGRTPSNTLDFLSNSDLSFDLFGTQGSTGLAEMTADEILDDSFWLRLPDYTPMQSRQSASQQSATPTSNTQNTRPVFQWYPR